MDLKICKIFSNLERSQNDILTAASLPFNKNHLIGKSTEGYPMFFIECKLNVVSQDFMLKYISVLFNRDCRIIVDQKESIRKQFTIIILKTNEITFQNYFIDVIALVIKRLPKEVSSNILKAEMQELVNLFSSFTHPPLRTVQGLWAELFIIEQAKDPTYLIQSWHTTPNDKFDFNDGKDKIEVKSTSLVRRIHSFSHEQLIPNKNSNLIIASIFVIETGRGKSIINLRNSIFKRVDSLEIQIRLNDIIAKTIRSDLDSIFSQTFDYQLAIDSLLFYDYIEIPKILSNSIPYSISNIRYDCDLSDVKSINNSDFVNMDSLLFQSLSNEK